MFMNRFKLLFTLLIAVGVLSSCVFVSEDRIVTDIPVEGGISLNELISSYDLWYVDYHRTEGNGDVPFVSKTFTLSFFNGRMYANNNIVDVGMTGDGFGLQVGRYGVFNTVLETQHSLDGNYDFEVIQLSSNEIRIDYLSQNVSYYLVGYQRDRFDYDKLFYDNIEYFLQEYVAWERIDSEGGVPNAFDREHYLQFTPQDDVTFYSSQDPFGINIDRIAWDFVGLYEVANVRDTDNLKILTLNYEEGDTEVFELRVINSETVALYHINSETTYTFAGRGFIRYLRNNGNRTSKTSSNTISKSNGRKRSKIERKTIERRNLQ